VKAKEEKFMRDKKCMRGKTILLSIIFIVLASFAIAGDDLRPVPKTPSAVIDIVFARPFTLAKGYTYDWSKERPLVSSGILVVLKVNPDLVIPRDSAEPVLYVGNQTAQRLNHGHESGYVIAIIPGDVDLTQVPIWFGSPELPERVNAEMIRSERTLAEAAKIRPFGARKVLSVKEGRLQASDLYSLLRDHAAELVLKYSPQEKKLAETWRLPVAKASQKQQKQQ
jgi:hypothetical protein